MNSSHRMLLTLVLLWTGAAAQAQTPMDEAQQWFQNQQWEQAAEAYRALTGQHPDNGLIWHRLGVSEFQRQQHAAAIDALERSRALGDPTVSLPGQLLTLARAQAAVGQDEAVLASLRDLAATPARPWVAIQGAAEFESLRSSPAFNAIVETLKPCQTDAHRAFDFWVGDWQVTSPNRPGWVARNRITLANLGCSLHEHYDTRGGYTGQSINFLDSNSGRWHQTWIDNQGSPLYLEGGPVNDTMVLSDQSNRVTWSQLPDGRVRQHWQSTADGGQTWTTAFDGYYQRSADENLAD